MQENQIIDANFISKCERELAYSVGPIANFIIKQVLQSHPQVSLAELKLAKEFERRLLG
jgi:hypothetical protein